MLEQISLYSRFWALVPGYTLFPLHWAWQECEYAEWEWAENRNGNFNSFRCWLISRLPNRPSGGSFNRRQSGSTSSLLVLFHQRAICSKTNKYNNLMILCSVKASKFSVFFFFFFLLNCFHPQPSLGHTCPQHRLSFRTLSPFWFFVLNAMTKWWGAIFPLPSSSTWPMKT